MSSTLVSRLKFQNAYFVDGAPAFTDKKVLPGQEITVEIVENRPTEFEAEHFPISVLYEDEAILVVDKPAGMVVHPTWNRLTGTLLNRVLGYYVKSNQNCAVHVVNRLDRDTRGIVLFAKNAHVHALLYDMQIKGLFEKTYHALCHGAPEETEGEIVLPIRRKEGYTMLREIAQDGVFAHTRYRVLEKRHGMSLLELFPVTGRTHQLRLHCMAMGFPILGDLQYHTEESQEISKDLGYMGQELCAVTLSFPHPMTGETLTVKSKHDIFLPNG